MSYIAALSSLLMPTSDRQANDTIEAKDLTRQDTRPLSTQDADDFAALMATENAQPEATERTSSAPPTLHMSHNNSQTQDNPEQYEQAEKAAKDISDAAAEAIAQRVIDKKNAMQAESSASAVKKATEIFQDIKF